MELVLSFWRLAGAAETARAGAAAADGDDATGCAGLSPKMFILAFLDFVLLVFPPPPRRMPLVAG